MPANKTTKSFWNMHRWVGLHRVELHVVLVRIIIPHLLCSSYIHFWCGKTVNMASIFASFLRSCIKWYLLLLFSSYLHFWCGKPNKYCINSWLIRAHFCDPGSSDIFCSLQSISPCPAPSALRRACSATSALRSCLSSWTAWRSRTCLPELSTPITSNEHFSWKLVSSLCSLGLGSHPAFHCLHYRSDEKQDESLGARLLFVCAVHFFLLRYLSCNHDNRDLTPLVM